MSVRVCLSVFVHLYRHAITIWPCLSVAVALPSSSETAGDQLLSVEKSWVIVPSSSADGDHNPRICQTGRPEQQPRRFSRDQTIQASVDGHSDQQDDKEMNPLLEETVKPTSTRVPLGGVGSRHHQSIQVNTWNCRFCLFVNEVGNQHCVQCSKSRDLTPESSIFQTPEGKACRLCSFVNKKDAEICEVCYYNIEKPWLQ